MIRLPDLPLGVEAWVLVELEIPAGRFTIKAGERAIEIEFEGGKPRALVRVLKAKAAGKKPSRTENHFEEYSEFAEGRQLARAV